MATDAPQRKFVGVEWHRASLGNALVAIHERGLDNVRVIHGDAIYLLEKFIRPASVHATCVFFPDPWAGDRDACRRMVREQVLSRPTTGELKRTSRSRETALSKTDVMILPSSAP